MARLKRSILFAECAPALEAMKYEIAAELGLSQQMQQLNDVSSEFAQEWSITGKPLVDWPSVTAREAGSVGGAITARLIASAQAAMQNEYSFDLSH